jgi:hypothetical protein
MGVMCRGVEKGRDTISKQQQAIKDLTSQEHQMRKQIAVAQESLARLTKQMVPIFLTTTLASPSPSHFAYRDCGSNIQQEKKREGVEQSLESIRMERQAVEEARQQAKAKVRLYDYTWVLCSTLNLGQVHECVLTKLCCSYWG